MMRDFFSGFFQKAAAIFSFLWESLLNEQSLSNVYVKYLGMTLVGLIVLRAVMLFANGRRLKRGRGSARPRNVRAMMREGRRAEKRGDFRQAGDYYKMAARYDLAIEMYRRARSHRDVAALYEQDGNWAEAAQYYEAGGELEKAAAVWEKSGEFRRAGELLVKSKRLGQAAEVFERGENYQEAADLYLRAGQARRAAECYERSDQPAKAAELYEQCYIQERQRWRDSRQPAGSKDRDRVTAFAHQAGRLYTKAGLPGRAASVLVSAGLDCEAADALVLAGSHQKAAEIYYEHNQYQKAAEAYKQSGDLRRSHQIEAEMHLRQENIAEAARCFEQAEDLFQAGELYLSLGDRNKAAEMYLRGGDCRKSAEIFLEMGEPARAAQAYELGGDLKEAAVLFEKLRHLDKASEIYRRLGQHYQAAYLLYQMGNREDSITLLQKVDISSEHYYEASLLLGRIFVEQGMLDAARQRFDKLFSIQQPDAQAVDHLYLLAQAYEEHKEYEEALQVYDRILAENYSYRDVKARAEGLRRALTQVKKAMVETRTVAAGTKPAVPTVNAPQRYKILRRIGQGGMGVVYRAEDTVLHRIVAYKVLPPSVRENPKILDNFLQEARVAAALSHPNIVTVYDVGKEGSELYITMEFVDGVTLKEYLDHMAPLPIPELLNLGKQICLGMDYAHQRGVIHRDIKPANIMLGPDNQVKIMDFGLAKIVRETIQDKTTVKGTPMYMSPEQIIGKGVDHRSDIYSFGCTLYKMAAGRAPFTDGDLYYHHLHTSPSPPKIFNPKIPEALSRIILQCIEKDKAKRCQRILEVFKGLQSLDKPA